jgi:hypothetical protein
MHLSLRTWLLKDGTQMLIRYDFLCAPMVAASGPHGYRGCTEAQCWCLTDVCLLDHANIIGAITDGQRRVAPALHQ